MGRAAPPQGRPTGNVTARTGRGKAARNTCTGLAGNRPEPKFRAMSERRYSDDEVSEIFARATETQPDAPRQASYGEGMTLAELQEIGREAGIEPEAVAQAARSLERAPPIRQPAPSRFMGLPIGVAHVVELPYRMTDAQWERLVLDLRETFDAAGRVRTDGTFRQWRNGNLQVLVEPYGEGTRVRFRTMKGNSRSMMTVGLAFLAMTLFMLFQGGAENFLTFAIIGATMFGVGAVQVPPWAKLRKSQMEEIGQRLLRAGPDRELGAGERPSMPRPRPS